MRSVLSATLMIVALMIAALGLAASGARAQLTPPSTAGAKPKPVTTIPIRPALQKPEETANAMGQAERLALQSDLAWVGQYNGAITGDISERMVNAIKEFQKGRGAKPTGVLNPQERGILADTARKKQESVGWKIVTDPGTGVRLGIPAKLVPQQASDANGTKWTSPTGTIQIQLARRKEAGPVTAKLAEREKKEPGRNIDYTVVKPDFFVLSGLQGLKKFYLRGTFRGDEVRILTILYDQATESTVEPVVIAMSSAFNAFPPAAQIAGPPPRKTVEYGTGVVVSDDGAIIADRQITDGCLTVAIAGFGNADRVAEDKEHDLALLRIYGARGLKALNLANAATKTALDLTGIADPQNQGGAAAVTGIKASVAQLGGGSDIALTPAPAPGFSGAPAQDGDGKFAGVALLKPVQVAGPTNGIPAAQAVLVTADMVRDFLKTNSVSVASGSTDAKASVVRVICVRK
jgi:peptidoglycan hydrolase-like protein with peptidoglycan-binding domain